MKNSLNVKAVSRIANSFKLAYPVFNVDGFIGSATEGLVSLELKQRVQHIIKALEEHLPDSFSDCAVIIEKVKAVWIKGDEEDSFQVFAAWPVIDFIAIKGIAEPHLALPLLKTVTSLFSAEFAIRPFIEAYPELCYEYLGSWTTDSSDDVRRLVSEGTRPRLPWAPKLSCAIGNPDNNIKLLSKLKNDSSLYVRRSVANHLNDIAKDHPNIVLDLCESWYPTADDSLKWLIRHATRTLVKQGFSRVYPLLGFTKSPKLSSVNLEVDTKTVYLGKSLVFSVLVESGAQVDQSLVVDFSLDLVKANGRQQSKVFKLKNVSLLVGEKLYITKEMKIKEISTRRYYAGIQGVSVLVNGVVAAKGEFELLV